MNKMMAATISAGATTRAPNGTALPPKRALTMPAAHRHEDEEERPEQLGEQAPPLVPVVQEVELPDDRVRLPERLQRDRGPLRLLRQVRPPARSWDSQLTGHRDLLLHRHQPSRRRSSGAQSSKDIAPPAPRRHPGGVSLTPSRRRYRGREIL